MRQAGRYLPEFRKIRSENPNFVNLCLNEELSKEITLQPIRRFNLDAAIIFSDILLVPNALKQNVTFKKDLGPILEELDMKKMESVDEVEFIDVTETICCIGLFGPKSRGMIEKISCDDYSKENFKFLINFS